jgi:hypothetical protein
MRRCWRNTKAGRRRISGRYKSFGDDPFVVALDPAPKIEFSAWTYAQRRALELVAPGPEGRHNRQSVADRKRAFARS